MACAALSAALRAPLRLHCLSLLLLVVVVLLLVVLGVGAGAVLLLWEPVVGRSVGQEWWG